MNCARITVFGLGLLAVGHASAGQDVPKPAPIYAEYSSDLGAADVREVRLIVDGRDVTAEATITPLRVAYAPKEAMADGTHAASVLVVDSLGRKWTKEWTFDVAAAKPTFERVWSDDLIVELDRLPRQVRERRLSVAGWTQPNAEVVVRLGGSDAERVLASASGRFRANVDLVEGDNALALSARRVDTGDEGPEISLRVERLVEKPSSDEEDTVTKPPVRRLPVPRVGPPRVVLASAGELDLPVLHVPEKPATPPRRVESPPRAPAETSREALAGGERQLDPLPGDGDPLPEARVVITKPDDGEVLQPGHASVLGLAPSGWRVTVLVDGRAGGSDVANPAGRFTVARVELGSGPHELIAEAVGDGQVLRSEPVGVEVASPRFQLAPDVLALTTPQRAGSIARGGVQRVSGVAWDGAEIEIELNGRIVVREIAGLGGRFDVEVPLESGLNALLVEATSPDGARFSRSREYSVTSSSRTVATLPQAMSLERPGRAPLTGLRPRAGVPGAALPSTP